ncbi:MAG: hypothetical protein V4510_02885 [bacterium]
MSSLLDTVASAVDRSWPWFVALGTFVLVVVAIRTLWRMQARHHVAEPRGKAKVIVAIVASLLLGFGGYYEFAKWQDASHEGMHDTLITALNKTIGEGKYLDNAHTIEKRPGTIASAIVKLEGYNATLAGMAPTDPAYPDAMANKTTTWLALNQSRTDLRDAQVQLRMLTPNHILWHKVLPLLLDHRDDEAEDVIVRSVSTATITDPDVLGPLGGDDSPCARDAQGHCSLPLQPAIIVNSYVDLHGNQVPYSLDGPRVFENQREFNAQMDLHLRWFVYPGLTGLFLAPFAFTGGHILNKSYEPSTTVGFKKYPGKAAGFFLLAMAGAGMLSIPTPLFKAPPLDMFGIFAIPFAAWVLRDLHTRSLEGQIAL